jgi:hypothetical protein
LAVLDPCPEDAAIQRTGAPSPAISRTGTTNAIAELRAAFDSDPIDRVVLIANDLRGAWDVLETHLGLLDLTAHSEPPASCVISAMQLAWDRLRALLNDSVGYLTQHLDDGWPLLAELRVLEAKLRAYWAGKVEPAGSSRQRQRVATGDIAPRPRLVAIVLGRSARARSRARSRAQLRQQLA